MYEEALKKLQYIMLNSVSMTCIGIQEQEFYRTPDSYICLTKHYLKQLFAARV